jgi:hypothetical protein
MQERSTCLSANPPNYLSAIDAILSRKAPSKNKTHRRPRRRGGLPALRSLVPYRAIPPHSGALLQQQQKLTPIINLWFTGLKLSYSGAMESQFAVGILQLGKKTRVTFMSFSP